jgi:hypothetical protein
MTELKGIEEAVELLKEELPDAQSIEIRAEQMIEGRQKGVILVWVNSYEEKRKIYEKYGEGENLYPALYEGWEVRARKYPPYIRKKDRVENEEVSGPRDDSV